MLNRRICALTIVAGLFLPALLGCLTPASADAQTMQCCTQLNCPAAHQQACYSTSSPNRGSQSTPELSVALAAPVMAAHVAVTAKNEQSSDLGRAESREARLHSPPDLYTVQNSLLI